MFNRNVLKTAIERLDLVKIPDLTEKQNILLKWRENIASDKLKDAGEVSLHGLFLHDLFARVLGYAQFTDHPTEWNLVQEQKTDFDATKPDAALGFFTSDTTDTRAVIELKSANADLDAKQHRKYDNRSPVEQAFAYVPKSGKKCAWVIVSNYVELRFYHKNSIAEYESFKIAELGSEAEFKRFYALLAREHLLMKDGVSAVEALYQKSEEEEKNISKRFYAEYTQARSHLFEHLKALNPDPSPGPSPKERGESDLTPGPSPKARGDSLPFGEGQGGVPDPSHELFLLEKTQKLLDRFIFVCFCEDTGMLPAHIFRNVVKHAQVSFALTQQKIWPELKGLFRAIDQGSEAHHIHGFNGELFKPDPALDALQIGDAIFQELAAITDYDFASDLNVNILGHIFEQSITDLEELRANIRGEQLDRKQGKRKKEGVFYTPEYITRYIVEQAVGGWLNDRKQELGFDALPELTPEDDASIKLTKSGYKGNARVEQCRRFWEAYKEKLMAITVLDPACGSGAFLNQAFDFLYREGQQVNNELAKLSNGQTTVFDLNKHILSNNLYGVDLNHESVEITKLSLWLKTANQQSQLTALNNNIKCGNSLIDNPLVAGEKAFNWAQQFPAVMERGGFDVVIGNPPYVRQEMLGHYKPYFEGCYHSYHGMADLYAYFIEKGVTLLRPNGCFGYIVSNKWMRANYGKPLRSWLKQQHIQEIIDFGELPVFEDAATFPCILRIAHKEPVETFNVVKAKELDFSSLEEYTNTRRYRVSQNSLLDESWSLAEEYQQAILNKIKHRGTPLCKYVQGEMYRGIVTGSNEIFVIDEETRRQLIEKDAKSTELIKPFVVGDDIRHYYINYRERYLIFTRRGINIDDYSAIKEYLTSFKDQLMPKPKDWSGGNWQGRKSGTYQWYEIQDSIDYYADFEKPKIMYPVIAKESRFTFDTNGYFSNDKTFIIPTNDLYLLAILNSKLCWSFLKSLCSVLGDEDSGGRLELRGIYLKQVPIRPINLSDLSDKVCHDDIVERVQKMLELNQQFHDSMHKFLRFIEASYQPKTLSTNLQAFYSLTFSDFIAELKKQKVALTTAAEFELMDLFEAQKAQALGLQQQITHTDREIDQMVYALYGLTDDEIRIVEGT